MLEQARRYVRCTLKKTKMLEYAIVYGVNQIGLDRGPHLRTFITNQPRRKIFNSFEGPRPGPNEQDMMT